MGLFLLPLEGVVPLVQLVALGVTLAALLDAAVHSRSAFLAAGKQTRRFWVLVMAVGLGFSLLGLIAAIFYFMTVRPLVELAGPLRRLPDSDAGDDPYIRC
jgi:Protein of unknown function (DUF2516)